MTTKPLATVTGTMLAPGVSRNNRLYTRETIGRAVARMKQRISDPDGLPVVMRTHHDAGDNSRLIVGRITDVSQGKDGRASYTAELYNNSAGRDIAALVTPDKPALRSVSIHGYWLGNVERFRQGDAQVETADDLEIDAVDFTASPGVLGATVVAASYAGPSGETASGRVAISESVDATVTAAIVEQQPASLTGGPIRSKADLRRAIRSAGTNGSLREHIQRRASALGLTAMIPPTWEGSMTDSTPARGVAEAYVTVCVGGDQGNIVQVCVDNADADTLKKAARKAAKLAGNFLGDDDSGDGNFSVSVSPDQADDLDSTESVNVTVGGRLLSEAETRAFLTRTSGPRSEPVRAADAAEHTNTETESAVSETATPAAETAAPVLTDDVIAKFGAVVGAAVKEALAATAPKVKEKKAKADKVTSESTATPVEGKQKTGKHRSLKESVTEGDLQKALASERDRIKNELRDQLIKEGTLPSRKGFRVAESEAPKELTGDELWNRRKEIFAANVPVLFAGTDVGQPVDAVA